MSTLWETYVEEANAALKEHRLDDAEGLFIAALEVAERLIDRERPIALALCGLANVARERVTVSDDSRYLLDLDMKAAVDLYNKALRQVERAFGVRQLIKVGILRDFAALYQKCSGPFRSEEWRSISSYDSDCLGRAESLLTTAVHIQEEVLGSEHPDLAPTLEQLAAVVDRFHDRKGSIAQAQAIRRRAERIRELAKQEEDDSP